MTEDEPYLFHLGEEGTEPFVEDEYCAGFYLTDGDLMIEYDDGDKLRSVSLEFLNDDERAVVEKMLQDRNFWVQIVNALSGALKEKM